MSYIFNIFVIIIICAVLFLSKHFKIFLDNKIEKHKKYVGKKNSYFIGGIIIFLYFFYNSILNNEFLMLFLYLSFFLIGFLSDLKLLNNPNKRLLIQFITLFIFIILLDIKILETRLVPIDSLLQNNVLNYFFVVFCLLVLINGSNFVDGINTLLISYVIIVLLLMLIFFNNILIDINSTKNLIYILFVIFLFNLFGIIILGDSGSYLLSLYLGIFMIENSNSHVIFSPYLVVLLLWYPCFELLFSIVRRQFKSKESYNPDTNHLHQIIYKLLNSSNNFKGNLNHFITSFIIIFYNFISFVVGFKFYYSTTALIYISIINVIVYIFSYNFINAKLKQ